MALLQCAHHVIPFCLPQVYQGTGFTFPVWHPTDPHHCRNLLRTVPDPWIVHALPDRMPALPNTLHPLLPIITTSSSFFSSSSPLLPPVFANSYLRVHPAPLQHGGWGNHHEGWRHHRQHAGLAGLLRGLHPGQHLEHPQRQCQAEEVEAAGISHMHTGRDAHPQHGHPHYYVLCHNAAPPSLQLRVERGSV